MKCFINDDLLEIIDLHELCSSVSIAMLQMKTFLLGFFSLKKNPDILLVNTCRVLHSFPQFWNAGEVIRGGHQNNVLPF